MQLELLPRTHLTRAERVLPGSKFLGTVYDGRYCSVFTLGDTGIALCGSIGDVVRYRDLEAVRGQPGWQRQVIKMFSLERRKKKNELIR